MKERKKEDFKYFGGKTWLASLLNMPYFWLFGGLAFKKLKIKDLMKNWLVLGEVGCPGTNFRVGYTWGLS